MVGVRVGAVEGEGVGVTVPPVTPTRKKACDQRTTTTTTTTTTTGECPWMRGFYE